MSNSIPQVLVVDDLFGREIDGFQNEERALFCLNLHLADVTEGKQEDGASDIMTPIAEAYFHRGQKPVHSSVGDVVENDLESVLDIVRRGREGQPWALVLLDLQFLTGTVTRESDSDNRGVPAGCEQDQDPDSYFGLEILRAIGERYPDMPVIILSATPQEEVAREYARMGAKAFLSKGSLNAARMLNEYLDRYGMIPDFNGLLIGQSLPLMKAMRRVRGLARDSRIILIRGESGTGKELFARYIHGIAGPDTPFVAYNAGVLEPNSFYAELFGAEPGSYTDARGLRIGIIEQADGGWIFLDEIGEIDSKVQVGFLRVLEEGSIRRLGGKKPIPVNTKFIFATNGDIEEKVTQGIFREDLAYRIKASEVFLPPLRERKTDIPILTEYFVRKMEGILVGRQRKIEPDAMAALCAYDWPGNIRELRSRVEAVVKEYRDLDHMFRHHIDLPIEWKGFPLKDGKPGGLLGHIDGDATSIIRGTVISEDGCNVVAGAIADIQSVAARHVRDALMATLRRTASNPNGKVQIQPAMRLLTGNDNLSTASAADLVKRLLKIDRKEAGKYLSDPLLMEAYKTARRLRPEGKEK